MLAKPSHPSSLFLSISCGTVSSYRHRTIIPFATDVNMFTRSARVCRKKIKTPRCKLIVCLCLVNQPFATAEPSGYPFVSASGSPQGCRTPRRCPRLGHCRRAVRCYRHRRWTGRLRCRYQGRPVGLQNRLYRKARCPRWNVSQRRMHSLKGNVEQLAHLPPDDA